MLSAEMLMIYEVKQRYVPARPNEITRISFHLSHFMPNNRNPSTKKGLKMPPSITSMARRVLVIFIIQFRIQLSEGCR